MEMQVSPKEPWGIILGLSCSYCLIADPKLWLNVASTLPLFSCSWSSQKGWLSVNHPSIFMSYPSSQHGGTATHGNAQCDNLHVEGLGCARAVDLDDWTCQLPILPSRRKRSRIHPAVPLRTGSGIPTGSVEQQFKLETQLRMQATQNAWDEDPNTAKSYQVMISSEEKMEPQCDSAPLKEDSCTAKLQDKALESEDSSSSSGEPDSVDELDAFQLRKAMRHHIILDEQMLVRAQSVVRRVLQAWVFPAMASLKKCIRDLEGLTVSVALLQRIGLGYVVSNKDIWKNEDDKVQKRIRILRNQWKAIVLKMSSRGPGAQPLC